jgi:tetratricopeptide (TPR) repeat protein
MCRLSCNLSRAWSVAVLCALSLAGCRSLDRAPVAQSVVEGRQLTQQGVNAMERGDWRRAESLLERAVATNEKDADARRNYAETLWQRGAKTDALVQLESARKLDNCDPGLAVRTGEIYLAMGQINSASDMVEVALRADPKFAQAWALRGSVSAARGKQREALADFQRALAYAPDNYDFAILVVETYRELNEPEQALVALETLADRFPPGEAPQQVLHLQGLTLATLARHDDAARMLAAAAQRDRPNAELLYHLARAELAAGRPQYAHYALEQALARDPTHRPSQALASELATAGQPLRR